jgi:hypothetical protein
MTSTAELSPEAKANRHSVAHRLREAAQPEHERKKNVLEAEPARPDYRTSPITEAFPWVATIDRAISKFELDRSASIFLVVFTSRLKGDADPSHVKRLHRLDEATFKAAYDAEGFIDYYADTANEDGEARSYCLWQVPGAARIVSHDKSHEEAQTTVYNYDTYDAEPFMLHRCDAGVWFQHLRTGERSLSITTKDATSPGG